MFKIRSQLANVFIADAFCWVSPCSGETWQGQVQEIWVQENFCLPKVMVYVTKQQGGHLEYAIGIQGWFYGCIA